MKNKLLWMWSICSMMTIGMNEADGAEVDFSSKDGNVIVIHQNPTEPIGAPRMPAYNPFYAELMGSCVILGSSTSYGTVSVEITSTAGDDYSTNFDTSTGTILLPISGDSGDYHLTITTTSGLQFVGEFII